MTTRYGRKVQLDEEIGEALEQVADERGESMTETANQILREALIDDGSEPEEGNEE